MLRQEFDLAMALSGCPTLAAITQRSCPSLVAERQGSRGVGDQCGLSDVCSATGAATMELTRPTSDVLTLSASSRMDLGNPFHTLVFLSRNRRI